MTRVDVIAYEDAQSLNPLLKCRRGKGEVCLYKDELGSKRVEQLKDKSLSSYPPSFLSSKPAPTLTLPHREGKQAAFTLAEVLITLGIIGVVAALTLPTLIQSYKEKQTVTAVKKAYSIFSQALNRITVDYPDISALVDSNKSIKENSGVLIDELSKYLNLTKICYDSEDCMSKSYINLTGTSIGNFNKYHTVTGVLNDGMSFWLISNIGEDNRYEGQMGIDINGDKKPNQIGVDLFWMRFDKNGKISLHNYKRKTNTYVQCDIENKGGSTYNGYECTQWIISEENMDYLKRRVTIDTEDADEETEETE